MPYRQKNYPNIILEEKIKELEEKVKRLTFACQSHMTRPIDSVNLLNAQSELLNCKKHSF